MYHRATIENMHHNFIYFIYYIFSYISYICNIIITHNLNSGLGLPFLILQTMIIYN